MDKILVPAKPDQKRITSSFNFGPRTSDLGPLTLSLGPSSLLFFSLLVLLTAMAGCGKKAMPSAPDTRPVPPVTDLSHEVGGGYVHLEWRVPTDIIGGVAVVSRSRTKISDDMCDGCPLVFQQIAVLEIPPNRSAPQTYREPLSPGFRYTYRVVLREARGRTSAPSNLVTFDY
jgi:hypothetical protein